MIQLRLNTGQFGLANLQIGLCRFQRHAVIPIVEGGQHFTGFYLLVVTDVDAADIAGNLGGHQRVIGAHDRIIGTQMVAIER
ncbi:hypothetical protein D3C73_1507130 [compost metagenome]